MIVVSLTSFPAAVPYAADAVRSILAGSVLPDRVVLYLDGPRFPGGVLPEALEAMRRENPRFEVRFCDDDIRSYTKLVPALADFPDDVVVTVDDDVWYDRGMLRSLLKWHERLPGCVIAHRVKVIRHDKPYRKWKKLRWYHFLFRRVWRDYRVMQTGVAGVLYPPHSLDAGMIDSQLFKELAPTVDDVWFWAAAVARGTYVVPVPWGPHNKPRGLKKPRELALKTANFKTGEDRNSAALHRIFARFPAVADRLSIHA